MDDTDNPNDAAPPLPPAGWYPDPSGAPGQRYFDGANWTEHQVAARGAAQMSKPDTEWRAVARGVGRVYSHPLMWGLVIKPLQKLGDEKRGRPGWYPDPSGQARLRWWDGRAWTGWTNDGVAEASGPPA